MKPPHVIQLRYPWQRERLADGRRAHRRHFHRPSGLGSADRVELLLRETPPRCEIRLNGHRLDSQNAATGEFRQDITAILLPRNLVEILLPPDTGAAGPVDFAEDRMRTSPPCVVCLEIRSDASVEDAAGDCGC